MAAGRLPEPGTRYGPCPGGCSHLDCAETRRMADAQCGICGMRIGYDHRFYQNDRGLEHATCAEDAAGV